MQSSLLCLALATNKPHKGGGTLRHLHKGGRPPSAPARLCGFPCEACWRPRQGKARQTARQDQLSRAKAKQARQPSQIRQEFLEALHEQQHCLRRFFRSNFGHIHSFLTYSWILDWISRSDLLLARPTFSEPTFIGWRVFWTSYKALYNFQSLALGAQLWP